MIIHWFWVQYYALSLESICGSHRFGENSYTNTLAGRSQQPDLFLYIYIGNQSRSRVWKDNNKNSAYRRTMLPAAEILQSRSYFSRSQCLLFPEQSSVQYGAELKKVLISLPSEKSWNYFWLIGFWHQRPNRNIIQSCLCLIIKLYREPIMIRWYDYCTIHCRLSL